MVSEVFRVISGRTCVHGSSIITFLTSDHFQELITEFPHRPDDLSLSEQKSYTSKSVRGPGVAPLGNRNL